MIVFKCVTAKEITELCKNDGYINNNEPLKFYKYSTLVENFFKSKTTSIINQQDNNIMFMVAEIPDEILEKYEDYTFYESSGLPINYLSYIPLPEYNIPKSLFLKSYIVEFTPFIREEYRNNLDFEKYMYLFNETYKIFQNLNEVENFLRSNNLEELFELIVDNKEREFGRVLNTLSKKSVS